MATVIEADGSEREELIDWSIEGIRAAIGGGFNIVSNYRGQHVIEADDWYSRGCPINRAASEKCGLALHGRIIIIQEHGR